METNNPASNFWDSQKKENNETPETNSKDQQVWIIAIMVLAILAFIITAGGLQNLRAKLARFNKKRNEANETYSNLTEIIKIKEKKKKQLDRLFNISYFLSRSIIVLTIVGGNAYLYFGSPKIGFDMLMDFNQMLVAGYALLTFWIHGSVKELFKTFENLKLYLRSFVFRNHINIEEEITTFKKKAKKERKKMKKLDKSIEGVTKNLLSLQIENSPTIEEEKKLVAQKT